MTELRFVPVGYHGCLTMTEAYGAVEWRADLYSFQYVFCRPNALGNVEQLGLGLAKLQHHLIHHFGFQISDLEPRLLTPLLSPGDP